MLTILTILTISYSCTHPSQVVKQSPSCLTRVVFVLLSPFVHTFVRQLPNVMQLIKKPTRFFIRTPTRVPSTTTYPRKNPGQGQYGMYCQYSSCIFTTSSGEFLPKKNPQKTQYVGSRQAKNPPKKPTKKPRRGALRGNLGIGPDMDAISGFANLLLQTNFRFCELSVL